MTHMVNVHEAKARLVPYSPPVPQRTLGNDAGKVVTTTDFDDPLPEFEAI